MIKIKNLTKKFGAKTIYSDFNFCFENGYTYGIKGSSGSGKSTLLNLIGQIDLEYEGVIQIDDIVIEKKDKKLRVSLLKEKIFYLFQNYALVDDKTISENFDIITAINPKYKKNKITALENVGLDKTYLDLPIYALSGGEQQRVSLARMYLRDYEIILADEPTGNLDTENGRLVFDILKSACKHDKVVIIATHNENILNQCDKVLEIVCV